MADEHDKMPPQSGARLSLAAMGTRFELLLPDGERAAGEAALAEIESLDRRLSWFDPSSALSRINEGAADHPVRVAGDIFDLLTLCRRMWEATGGAFDPTVAPLMCRFGFRDIKVARGIGSSDDPCRSSSDYAKSTDRGRPVPPQTIGMNLVELDEATSTVRFTRPGVSIDLGGIAKGWALDAAVAILRDAGVTSAFIHGGTSSVAAIGNATGRERRSPRANERAKTPTLPDGRVSYGWRVSLGPTGPAVTLHNQSLSVSTAAGRTVNAHGHIMDPRASRPAASNLLAAVVAPAGAVAEAWSTALVVLGRVPECFPPDCRAYLLNEPRP